MKISAKGRYGLAAMIVLARSYESSSPVTIISISEHLGISKIYLEQVFYQLSRHPREITAYEILSSIEISLIEKTGTVSEKMDQLNHVLARELFEQLDKNIFETLNAITLEGLLTALIHEESSETLMYFI